MRALYVGYTKGTKNHGDEALIWIIRDLLAPEIEVITEGSDYDVALLGGGTLINQSPWLIDQFESALNRAGRGVVFGTGVGDLDFWGNHFDCWVPLLRRCEAVGVRGPHSLALLQRHGFMDAIVTGDPYLWLRPPVRRRPVAKHLGVNFGSTNNALLGAGRDEDLGEFLAEVLDRLGREGWSFSFLSVWSQDVPLLERLRARLGPAAGPLFDSRLQPLETFSMLASCDLFLGEKLHANAMAAVAGVPFVALEYQPKVRDFAASLDMEPWVVSTAERDPAVVVARIRELNRRNAEARRGLARARARLRASLSRFTSEVRQRLLRPDTVQA
mgnify:CR=1 FL=1